MRQHSSLFLCLTAAWLLGLVGCAADSAKSSSKTPPTSPTAQVQQGNDQLSSEEIQERGVPRVMRPGPSGPLINAPPPVGFVDLFPFLFTGNCSVVKYMGVPVQLLVGVGNVGTVVAPPTQVRVQVSQAQTTIQPATIDTPVPSVNPSTFVTVAVTLPNRFYCDGGACQFVITVDPAGAVQEQGQYYGFGKGNNTTIGTCYFGG